MQKVLNLFPIVSNKTIRPHEKFYKKYPYNKALNCRLIETNRGFFINSCEVDRKSVEIYLSSLTK